MTNAYGVLDKTRFVVCVFDKRVSVFIECVCVSVRVKGARVRARAGV